MLTYAARDISGSKLLGFDACPELHGDCVECVETDPFWEVPRFIARLRYFWLCGHTQFFGVMAEWVAARNQFAILYPEPFNR